MVKKYGQAEVMIPYPGLKALDYLTRHVSISSVKNKNVFISVSPATIEWFISGNFNYIISPRAEAKGAATATSINQAMEWQSYPTYPQYDSIMQYFAATYPTLCKLDTVGTSINGRLVLALKISDNVKINEDEPAVFYSSTMHGDELAGYVLMLRLADYLLKNYNFNTTVKNLVDNLEIWINPLANPDGTYTSGNTVTSPTRGNADGIDLNRNFPDPFTPNSVREKETIDMVKFMRKHRFLLSANFHSGDEVVNYPWDRWSRLHADDNWFNEISRSYADTAHNHSVTGYMTELDNGITNGYQWYWIYGGRQDFVTYELQGREVTIELDYTKITSGPQLELLWMYNYRSMLEYLENSLYGIHGIVRDAHTLQSIPAKIFIAGHDKDSSHIYSDTLSGRFVRLIYPGTWNITFSANGYKDTVVNDVIVTEHQRTDLFVEMKPITTIIDSANLDKAIMYPNPASNFIKFKLPDNIAGPVNIRIYNQTGIKVADYNTEETVIDLKGFSAGAYTVLFTNTVSRISCTGRFIITGRF